VAEDKVADIVVRPSLRRAKFGLFLALIADALVAAVYILFRKDLEWWFLLVGLIPLVPPLIGWLDQKRTSLRITGAAAHFDHGLFGGRSRVIQLSSISEVKVEKSLSQKMWGIGTLLLEIPGSEGRIVIQDVDKPAKAAEQILARKGQPGPAPTGSESKA
jgi:uncharacterized membrane protein YdbT with pleckstrin-like domain